MATVKVTSPLIRSEQQPDKSSLNTSSTCTWSVYRRGLSGRDDVRTSPRLPATERSFKRKRLWANDQPTSSSPKISSEGERRTRTSSPSSWLVLFYKAKIEQHHRTVKWIRVCCGNSGTSAVCFVVSPAGLGSVFVSEWDLSALRFCLTEPPTSGRDGTRACPAACTRLLVVNIMMDYSSHRVIFSSNLCRPVLVDIVWGGVALPCFSSHSVYVSSSKVHCWPQPLILLTWLPAKSMFSLFFIVHTVNTEDIQTVKLCSKQPRFKQPRTCFKW